MKKTLIVPLAALVLGGVTVFGVHRVYAQTQEVVQDEVVAFGHAGMKAFHIGPNDLARRIAEKFGLQESEVQAVFQEFHAEQETRIEQEMEDRLNEAVANGELTAEQRQLILDKRAELEASMPTPEEFESMSEEERREFMKTDRVDLKAWAEENGIDLKYFGMVKFVHRVQ